MINEELTKIKDSVDMLDNVTSVLMVLQATFDINSNLNTEDVARTLFVAQTVLEGNIKQIMKNVEKISTKIS